MWISERGSVEGTTAVVSSSRTKRIYPFGSDHAGGEWVSVVANSRWQGKEGSNAGVDTTLANSSNVREHRCRQRLSLSPPGRAPRPAVAEIVCPLPTMGETTNSNSIPPNPRLRSSLGSIVSPCAASLSFFFVFMFSRLTFDRTQGTIIGS